MPAQLKEVRTRIKSVKSTQQITKAMRMVSAAKLRRAQDSITHLRPYAQNLQEILSNIVSNSSGADALSLSAERPAEKILLIVISSDKGLCGAYNANIIKLTKAVIHDAYAEQNTKGNVTIWNIGKKAYESLTRAGYKTDSRYRDIFQNPSFDAVQEIATAATQAFEKKEYDVVKVVYSQFVNALYQKLEVESFLPIPKAAQNKKEKKAVKADFIFEPNQTELLSILMPKMLNAQLYKAILDASASEQGARMTAMDKASQNAQALLKSLTLMYNRARQAAITTELTEIVSGAAALQG